MFKKFIQLFSKKTNLIFVFIVVLAAFLRFYKLGTIPMGIVNDEAGYMYSAYSIWMTGHDLAGKFLPLSINLDNSFSPIPIYLGAPFIGILGLSPFVGRLPFALIGLGSVILIYFIAKQLFNNRGIALASMFVIAVSPWHIQFSRAAYDAGLVVFLILLGTYLFMKGIKAGGGVLWSIPIFILAFYTYHATKIFLVFYIPLLLFYYRVELLKIKKVFLIFVVVSILTLLSFLVVMKTQNVTRQNVLLWNDTETAKQVVDLERAKNSAPFFIREIFNNKPLYFLRIMRENYLEAFSPNLLFLYGERSAIYGIHFRGPLYIIELPLLILGLYFLFAKAKKPNRLFILVAIFLAPLPSAVTLDKAYMSRSVMLLPFFSILIGCGIYYLSHDLFAKNKKIYIAAFISIYIFLIISYFYQYQFRYSIYGAETWHKSSRDLAIYMGAKKNENKNIYLFDSEEMFLMQYGVFNKLNPLVMQKEWQSNPRGKMGNVTFMQQDCIHLDININNFNKKNDILVVPEQCARSSTPSAIIRELAEPLRIIWKIYEN